MHAIAFAPGAAMEGRYLDTTRDDWVTALEVSAYSLVSVAKAAEFFPSARRFGVTRPCSRACLLRVLRQGEAPCLRSG